MAVLPSRVLFSAAPRTQSASGATPLHSDVTGPPDPVVASYQRMFWNLNATEVPSTWLSMQSPGPPHGDPYRLGDGVQEGQEGGMQEQSRGGQEWTAQASV